MKSFAAIALLGLIGSASSISLEGKPKSGNKTYGYNYPTPNKKFRLTTGKLDSSWYVNLKLDANGKA